MGFWKILIFGVSTLILLGTSSLYAKAYKCTLNGNVSYQSQPCKDSDKDVEMDVKIKKITGKQACFFTCNSEKFICISELANPIYNNDGSVGVKVCSLKQDWCNAICENAKNILEKKYTYMSAKNSYKYKRKIDEIDENAEQRKNKRASKRYDESKANCIKSGMKVINKIQSRVMAWEREKELKKGCEKKARNEVTQYFYSNAIDDNAEQRKNKLASMWYEESRANCIKSGMKVINKIQSRVMAWEREEELKKGCEKEAKNEVTQYFYSDK